MVFFLIEIKWELKCFNFDVLCLDVDGFYFMFCYVGNVVYFYIGVLFVSFQYENNVFGLMDILVGVDV